MTSENLREGNAWVQTRSGGVWWPADPRVEDVHFEDFAALADINRYNGHTLHPQSVCSHSVSVALSLLHDKHGPETAYRGLLHDAHEIYPPGDTAGPIRKLLGPAVAEMERKARNVVRTYFGIPSFLDDIDQTVHEYDMRSVASEKVLLMADCEREWRQLPPMLPVFAMYTFAAWCDLLHILALQTGRRTVAGHLTDRMINKAVENTPKVDLPIPFIVGQDDSR